MLSKSFFAGWCNRSFDKIMNRFASIIECAGFGFVGEVEEAVAVADAAIIVVSGKGLIQQRRIGSDEVLNFAVSGEKIQAVHMLPGYTHNIINLSETENLVTVMWANEAFDPQNPDTFYLPVEE